MTIAISTRLSTPRNKTPKSSSQRTSASGARILAAPAAAVIMGVSGSGKPTIAAMLAGRLHWRFEEGDNLHSPANIEKMSRGIPLTDDDREPWLRAIAAVLSRSIADGIPGGIARSGPRPPYTHN